MTLLAEPPPRRATTLRLGNLHAVAVFDDYQAGIRAQQVLHWLKCSLCPQLDVRTLAWNFDRLESLEMRSMAVREAATADVVIIAAAEATSLPYAVKRWLEATLRARREGPALIVALHGESSGQKHSEAPLCAYLDHLSQRTGAQRICGAGFCESLRMQLAAALTERKAPLTPFGPILRSISMQTGGFRWGINE